MASAPEMGTNDDREAPRPEVLELQEKFGSALGQRLRGEFVTVEGERHDIEQEWLKDLRQYNGEYDPEVLAKIDPARSKAFIRLTRVKVKTLDAQIYDMLFPGGGEKNYAIEPTPIPTIDPEQHKGLVDQLAAQKLEQTLAEAEAMAEQQGLPVEEVIDFNPAEVAQAAATGQVPERFQPSEAEVREAVEAEAAQRAEAMAGEIEDQLTESKYPQHVRKVIHSGHLYGTGVLKGPMVERYDEAHYALVEGRWQMVTREVRRPYVEHTPLWDFYPDMSVADPDDAEFFFERHVYNRQQLRKLAKRKDFKGKAIRAYLEAHPGGDAQVRNWESELRAASRDQVYKALDRRKRYEVLEYWGLVTVKELAELGLDLPEDLADGEEVEANIWLLGDVVIKAALNPTAKQWRPYYLYYFEKDETSIFGRGVPYSIRDTQIGANAAVRVMQDNAAITAGPLIEVNRAYCNDPNPTEVFPFKVFTTYAKGAAAQHPAVRITHMGSNTSEFMAMFQMWKDLGDEVSTVPSYVHGSGDKEAGGTARGLSMLMGAQRVTVKDIMENFDDGVTSPFISNLYDWNMRWSRRDDIKGDYKVKARGSTALIARELYAESLDMLAQTTKDPVDGPYIKRGELLRERVRARDVDADRFIKTDEQVQAEQEAQREHELKMKRLDEQAALRKAQVQGEYDLREQRLENAG